MITCLVLIHIQTGASAFDTECYETTIELPCLPHVNDIIYIQDHNNDRSVAVIVNMIKFYANVNFVKLITKFSYSDRLDLEEFSDDLIKSE